MSSSTVDYTPMILAQITDLQLRLTKQDEIISALRAEVDRLSGRITTATANVPSSSVGSFGHHLKTSVPLQHKSQHHRDGHRDGHREHRDNHREHREQHPTTQFIPHASQQRRSRPQVAKQDSDKTPFNLNDLINTGEQVVIKVGTGKDEEGNFTSTFAYATFDGTDLTVTKCELVPSLINLKTSKPGEILYKFMEELKNAGHLKRTFSIGPWKLCFVERDGALKSLEDIRNSKH